MLYYITAFGCGMTVMAVEISATRLLAPYFGTSMIVWAVVIGLIMIALGLGNILGGRTADRYQSPDRLFVLIWLAALWIALIPFIGKYVIAFSVFIMMWLLPNQLIVSGSVFSCLVVFSMPLVLLGMTPPYLVKLAVSNMNDNGKITGQIYACSTIGSIIGTFIPTFLTIPTAGIGTSKTFLIFALLLNIICLVFFIIAKTKTGWIFRATASALIIAGLLLIPFRNSYTFWKPVAFEAESVYNYIQVTEENDCTYLKTNVLYGIQSIYRKNSPLTGLYYDYMTMAPFFIPNTGFDQKLKILVLGLAGGTFSKQCKSFFPNSHIDGVEIDQKIVNIARKYLNLTSREATVFISDGRVFLSESSTPQNYDLIVVDAFQDISIPFQMSTREFFTLAKNHLRKNGVIMLNLNIHSVKNTELLDCFLHTLKSVMPEVCYFQIGFRANTIIIASTNTDCRVDYQKNIQTVKTDHPLYPIARFIDSNLQEIHTAANPKYVLNDEVAPVEMMSQRVFNEIVRERVGYFTLYVNKRIGSSKNKFQEIMNLIVNGKSLSN